MITNPIPVDSLMAQVNDTYVSTRIGEAALLQAYDAYYYSRDGGTPLPVLRVKFDDPDRTWFYIDPASGTLE